MSDTALRGVATFPRGRFFTVRAWCQLCGPKSATSTFSYRDRHVLMPANVRSRSVLQMNRLRGFSFATSKLAEGDGVLLEFIVSDGNGLGGEVVDSDGASVPWSLSHCLSGRRRCRAAEGRRVEDNERLDWPLRVHRSLHWPAPQSRGDERVVHDRRGTGSRDGARKD